MRYAGMRSFGSSTERSGDRAIERDAGEMAPGRDQESFLATERMPVSVESPEPGTV
jgi:hypothetical protein